MADLLQQIVEAKRGEVEAARAVRPLESVQAAAREAAPPRNFFAALTREPARTRVIAEIKKASPSAGLIREDFDPAAIARAYEAHGAAALSCLTDAPRFQGSLACLETVKSASNLPVLRKDFIIDPYQIWESRAAGADAVLLIAECLESEALLLDLLILATELKMSTLVEVHQMEQILRVRPHLGFPHPGYTLLGINNRDLRTMTTDVSHTLRLVDMVEDPSRVVSESGIRDQEDLVRLAKVGVNKVLVGEHLMRQPDPGEALARLIGPGG